MTDRHDVLTLVRMTNPIPDLANLDADEMAAERAAVEESLRAARAPGRRSAGSPQPWLRPAMIALAVAVVLVLAIGIPVFLTRTSDESQVVDEPASTTVVTSVAPTTVPSTTAVTTTPDPATTTTAVVASPLPEIPDVRLARSADLPEFEGVSLTGVVAGGPGLLAVGFVEERVGSDFLVDGIVFGSSDGITWEMMDRAPFRGTEEEEAAFLAQFISSAASGPQGIVAVGAEGYDAAVWHSSDGFVWTQVSAEALGGNDVQGINQVVAGGPGYVAVGRDGSAAGVWTSADGLTWDRVENPTFGSLQEPAVMFGVAATPAGLVAVGSGGFESDRWGLGFGDTPLVWTSADGLEWERLPVDTFGDPATFFFESVEASDQALFLGSSRDDTLRMWTSTDGITWEETAPIPCEGDDPLGIMISEPFGTPCRGVGYLEAPEGVDVDSNVLTVIGDQVVVAGTLGFGTEAVAAIWVGNLNG